eukprot:jgi/Mesvir1/20896/Mv07970-RA.1
MAACTPCKMSTSFRACSLAVPLAPLKDRSQFHTLSSFNRNRRRRVASPVSASASPAPQSQPPSLETLQKRFGSEGVQVRELTSGMRLVRLLLADGNEARISLTGAQVTSWNRVMWHGGQEQMLHVRVRQQSSAEKNKSASSGGLEVEGGLMVELPVSSKTPPGWRANQLAWELVDSASDVKRYSRVTLALEPYAEVYQAWATGPLRLMLTIELSPVALTTTLTAENKSADAPLTLRPGLATMLSVSNPASIYIQGLKGYSYFGGSNARGAPQGARAVSYDGSGVVDKEDVWFVDANVRRRDKASPRMRRVYCNGPQAMLLSDQGRQWSLFLEKSKFEAFQIEDLPDLDVDDDVQELPTEVLQLRSFQARTQVVIPPNGRWEGSQRLRFED